MINTTPALEVADLTHTFGAGAHIVHALDGVSLSFAPGSFTAVMGPSGSGKSTFLKCAGGLERPTSGRVVVGGDDITNASEYDLAVLRRERLGFVFQHFNLMPYLTAAQNVALPLRLAGERVQLDRIHNLLGRVGLNDRADHLPDTMSGGQQQRVAIARALVSNPAVVLADEPTGALDTVTAASVLDVLRSCVDDLGQAVIMVTHDPVAAGRADRVLFLVDGRIAGQLERPDPAAVAERMTHLDRSVVAA